jgi:hypothetical protein
MKRLLSWLLLALLTTPFAAFGQSYPTKFLSAVSNNSTLVKAGRTELTSLSARPGISPCSCRGIAQGEGTQMTLALLTLAPPARPVRNRAAIHWCPA